MKERTKRLRVIMVEHELKASDVARLLNRRPQTVRVWMAPQTDRIIPDHSLELLKTKLK